METKMVVEGRGGADGVRGTADSSGGRLLRMVAWGRGVELGFVDCRGGGTGDLLQGIEEVRGVMAGLAMGGSMVSRQGGGRGWRGWSRRGARGRTLWRKEEPEEGRGVRMKKSGGGRMLALSRDWSHHRATLFFSADLMICCFLILCFKCIQQLGIPLQHLKNLV
jgi:hypothetical protein